MKLNELSPAKGSRRKPKRVGRGPGSGNGKTAGRGHNGQKSRSGYSKRRGFEGGQMPLHRRLPKRGFTNIFRKVYRTVNVDRLAAFEAGSEIDPQVMSDAGLLRKGAAEVKVMGNGGIEVALTVRAHKFTKSATEKIQAAGGKAELLPPLRKPRTRKKFLKKSERTPSS
jgi:large subunit ribosomal protein L15